MTQSLKFLPLKSVIDPGFWDALTTKKLDEWKLDDTEKKVNWNYTPGKSYVRFDYDALEVKEGYTGTLRNFNTIEDFKVLDKKAYLQEALEEIKRHIKETNDFDIKKLFSPRIITFSDLKKYHYWFWVCFPTFRLSKPAEIVETRNLSLGELSLLHDDHHHQNFFIITNHEIRPFSSLGCISDDLNEIVVCFEDHVASGTTPENAIGVLGRNLLFYLWFKFKKLSFNICSIRWEHKHVNGAMIRDYSSSKVFTLSLCHGVTEVPGTGWELFKDKLAPKKVDLSASMDSRQLAGNAVDLNLKLMKWRLQPGIDLDLIKAKRVLLLGSGTLGCNVARALIGWGVRHITFVDNGKVSYSNPVRQSLFSFSDSESKVDKALAAAASLALISPNVTTAGVKLSIPMPGHTIDLDTALPAVDELKSLISDHDVVYLLMDTRESRWLPTVIGKAMDKLVINAALGFDTFMVMRHGVTPEETKSKVLTDPKNSGSFKINHLGCYFCNDVVAPANSTADRTLDQQCTVSRPGLSMIAGAYAVELMVSVYQHKDGIRAKAAIKPDEHEESCLGIVPHQIRGFLSQMNTILPTSQAFKQCTACSETILEMYHTNGIEFLMKVFNSSSGYLEDLTGLTELHAAAAEIEILEFSSDDDAF